MTARREILAAIAQHRRTDVPLPAIEGDWLRPDDLIAHFCDTVGAISGRVVPIATEDDLAKTLNQDRIYCRATTIASQITTIPSRGLRDMATEVVRGERMLDVTLTGSQLAVAENGAVYLEPPDRYQHALLFLCEHLFVVVPTKAIVATMHNAYEWLYENNSTIASARSGSGFGLFVSGPSKTADIEQALVIGAQGPRSLTILLIGR